METEQHALGYSRNQKVIAGIKREIKIADTNENDNITYQTQWDTTKVALREKLKAISTHMKKLERYQVNKLTMHIKYLNQQQQQTKLQISRKK